MTSASDLSPTPGGQVADPRRRPLSVVGFLGISDYGLGQLEVLASRYEVAFATAKKQKESFCLSKGIPYLGSADANSPSMVDRASRTDLVVIGGYDGMLKIPFLSAPKHGVINTHLGLLFLSAPAIAPNNTKNSGDAVCACGIPGDGLRTVGAAQLFGPSCMVALRPQNRGCCPTLWAQLHGRPQGFTTYLASEPWVLPNSLGPVGEAIDHGPILDMFEAPGLGGLVQNNRQVYDALAQAAVQRFPAALERFSAGEDLAPCRGLDIYHKKGMPNDGWLSFYWSDDFLIRFSLALDFAPYLPGRTRVEEGGEAIALAVEASCAALEDPAAEGAAVGEALDADEGLLLVKTRLGALRCRQLTGTRVTKGGLLISGRPLEQSAAPGPCPHAIPMHFSGQELPLELYLSEKCGAVCVAKLDPCYLCLPEVEG
eukprot:s3887_g3.t3